MVRKATIQDADNVFELVKDFATSFKPQKELFIQSFRNMLSDKKAFIFVVENGDIAPPIKRFRNLRSNQRT